MQRDIQTPPLPVYAVEHRLKHSRLLDVEWHEDRGVKLSGEWLHVRLGLVIQIRDRQLSPQPVKGASTTECDRILVGDAEHERLSTRKRRRGDVVHRELLRCPVLAATRRRVCLAIINSSFVGTTQAATRLSGRLMRGTPASLAAASNSSPSHAASRQTRARIAAEFSPMPPVNTSASSPPRAAAREPNSRRIR